VIDRRTLLTSSSFLLLNFPAFSADLPTALPSDVGMSRLDRITDLFKEDTESKKISGAVVMIARDGKVVYDEAFGMPEDSIFRLYSMTKPLTGVAVLILMEEGKLRLSDPVSDYLPVLKNPKVVTETVDSQGRRNTYTVPAKREITIHDLLTHTSGISYGIGNSAAEQAMLKAGLGVSLGDVDNPLSVRMTDQQFVTELAKLPLMFQPGTSWEYGRSIDVLLAMIEVISGKRGDTFMEERIFRPLGMTNTFFNLPANKLDKVAEPGPYLETGKTPRLSDPRKQRIFLSGGEGLLSTASDYMRFLLMLANGGKANGVRILSRKTVEYMTSDHLGPGLSQGVNFAPGPAYGFGLTVEVLLNPGMLPYPGSKGEFSWGGYGGTYFLVDPEEQLVAVMMIQAPWQRLYYRSMFRALLSQSLD